MTHERDIERLLDHWFSDGPTEAPDRVIDAVADRIGRESQRPAWRLDWRHTPMTPAIKFSAAIAAVVIVAIVGYNLLPRGSSGIGGQGATPSPTSTPSPIPIPSGEGLLAAGTYALTLDEPFPKLIITLPDGWSGSSGMVAKEINDTTVVNLITNASAPGDAVYAQPCQWSGTEIQPGPTVDGFASALATVPLRNATTPVDVTVGGYQGKYLEWSVPNDVDLATCDKQDGEARFMSWTGRWQQAPGQVDRLWILDIDGTRLVMDAWFLKETTEADRAELTQIMDSIRFEP
jgi:hypothetical protein